jgi:hypothetical protein
MQTIETKGAPAMTDTTPTTPAIERLMAARERATQESARMVLGNSTYALEGYEIQAGGIDGQRLTVIAYVYGEPDAEFIVLAYNSLPAVAAEMERLQARAEAVTPLVGKLLDAWEGMPNDLKADVESESPSIVEAIKGLFEVTGE